MKALIKLYDMDKRVPITFRVPVKKKLELLKCAKDSGASLTDVLEVLTEDPEQKIKHDLKELLFELTKTKARLKTKEDEIKIYKENISSLTEEMMKTKNESIENALKSLDMRIELLNLKEKYGEINSIPLMYKMVAA